MPGYIELPQKIFCWTEKAASRSMVNALKKYPAIAASEVLKKRDDKPVVLYIRHPLNRLASAWTHFAANGYGPTAYSPWPDFPAFCDKVLAGHINPHWDSQTDQHVYHDVFLPNEWHRLEDITKTWPKRHPLLNVNQAKHPKPDIFYREQDLMLHYRRDLLARGFENDDLFV